MKQEQLLLSFLLLASTNEVT